MKLRDVDYKNMVPYWYAAKGKIVYLVNCDRIDGAALIVESCDSAGDIFSDEFFRCEASQLEVCSRAQWESIYPPSEDNVPFPGVW